MSESAPSNGKVAEAMHVMEEYTGVVPGYRRAHPRGAAFRGTFTASAEVGALTTAEHLQGARIETVVRLSNAAGSPYAPDRLNDHQGNVLGLAVRFELPSGEHATWAAPNIPGFPAATPEDFIALTTALKRSPRTNKPNPARLLAYAATRRHTVPGLKGIVRIGATESFATTQYNGLHAYYLVAPDGQRRAFRYSWVPDAGFADIAPEDHRVLPPQYLISEMKQRLETAPVTFSLVFQLAEPGDEVDDVTRTWPDDRPTVLAGQLTIDRLHEDQDLVEGYVFDPTNVPTGIELSDDPILHFRSKVYSESYNRRTHESKPSIKPE